MKVLNIKSDGTFIFVNGDVEGVSDTANAGLSAADQRLFQDEIDTLQAQNLQEIHLEQGPTKTFVHKVGKGKFIVEDDPNVYNVFLTMDQWSHNLV